MDGYVNPYNRSPYGGLLSATQGFLNAYMQHQKMRHEMRQTEIMNQFRQSLETGRQEDVYWKKQRRLAFEAAPPDRRMDFFVRREPTVNVFTPGQAKGFSESAARFLIGAAEGGKLSREKALEAYKLYRAQAGSDKPDISEAELKQIDAGWDAAAIYNVSPYEASIPEIEGGWEPDTDPEIRALRPYLPAIDPSEVEKQEPKPETKGWLGKAWGAAKAWPGWTGAIWDLAKGTTEEETIKEETIEPQTKTEFINELRRLNITDPNAAKKYYEQYLDKFW